MTNPNKETLHDLEKRLRRQEISAARERKRLSRIIIPLQAQVDLLQELKFSKQLVAEKLSEKMKELQILRFKYFELIPDKHEHTAKKGRRQAP